VKKADAVTLSNLLASVNTAYNPSDRQNEYIGVEQLRGFHPWADYRRCVGAYLFQDHEDNDNCLWVLLLDWRINENYYIVLFPESRTGPLVEIHRLTVNNGEKVLHWRYSPSKRDGRNEKRMAYFVDAFLSDNVRISVPNNLDEVDDFIEELFSLVSSRTKADELDQNLPSVRSGFPEGKLKERLHLSRERNRELVLKAKLLAKNRYGCLKCACCGFDFFATYGEVGKGFIEAHHTKPVSTLHENGGETKIEDIALVCSNCHRMLHRKRPWLKMNELSSLLTSDRQ